MSIIVAENGETHERKYSISTLNNSNSNYILNVLKVPLICKQTYV